MEEIKINWGKQKYEASWGAFKYKGDPNIVAHEIESIGDAVTSRQIVDYASENREGELAKCFEWNDDKAADQWRLFQAGSIVRNLKITIIKSDTEKEPTPIRYFSMKEASHGTYEKTEVIVRDIDKYEVLLATAKKELQEFKAKYSRLSELEAVFEAIDRL